MIMPDFRFTYERRRSLVTGLFTDRPMLNVVLNRLHSPGEPALRLRFRVDTGANMSAIPLQFAADVLGYFPKGSSPSDVQLKSELQREMMQQNLKPIVLRSTSGMSHSAFPLWVPVEMADDDGEVGEFQALIAFVEGQVAGAMLAGLTGFLDKFDLYVLAQHFELHARPNSGVSSQLHTA